LMREEGNVPGDEDSSETIQALHTADELLALAGLHAQNAETLSDFEEDASLTVQIPKPDSHSLLAPQPDSAQSAWQQRYVEGIPCQELIITTLTAFIQPYQSCANERQTPSFRNSYRRSEHSHCYLETLHHLRCIVRVCYGSFDLI